MKAIKRNVALLAAMGLMAGSGAVWAIEATDSFTATAALEAGISVSCAETSLSFGTIQRSGSYDGSGTVTVQAEASAGGATTADGLAVSGGNSVACTVTNETGGDATAALSAGSGSQSGSGVNGLKLANGDDEILANLALSLDAAIKTNDTIYVGGTLSVPAFNADTSPNGTYTSGNVTLTVTE